MKSWRVFTIQLTLLLLSSAFAILGFGFVFTSAWIYIGSIEAFGRLPEYDKQLIRLDSTDKMFAGVGFLLVSCCFYSMALLRRWCWKAKVCPRG